MITCYQKKKKTHYDNINSNQAYAHWVYVFKGRLSGV